MIVVKYLYTVHHPPGLDMQCVVRCWLSLISCFFFVPLSLSILLLLLFFLFHYNDYMCVIGTEIRAGLAPSYVKDPFASDDSQSC